MKIIAKQVPPEYKDSMFDPEWWPGIIFHGNRRYLSHTTPEFDAVWDRFDGEKRILRALHLVTGKRYEKRTIRGLCQGDWQDIYYPVAEYTPEALSVLEIEYFNMGTQWSIEFENNRNVFSHYCYAYDYDDMKKEIADAIGENPEDITLHRFHGWKKIPVYVEVLPV